MALQKMVDGELVDMSAEEEAATRAEWAANAAAQAAQTARQVALAYREARAIAYRDRLGKEKGDVVKTLGDVLDIVIAQVAAIVPAQDRTPEFAAMLAEIVAIKTENPKPSE